MDSQYVKLCSLCWPIQQVFRFFQMKESTMAGDFLPSNPYVCILALLQHIAKLYAKDQVHGANYGSLRTITNIPCPLSNTLLTTVG